MTSFKSAQLIANSNDADKVIFLTDRIELGTQSLKEYRAFADENETVQATENTYVLLTKLKSNATADTLIVTSIQKMSNIRDEDGGLNASDIEIINGKRLVFIMILEQLILIYSQNGTMKRTPSGHRAMYRETR